MIKLFKRKFGWDTQSEQPKEWIQNINRDFRHGRGMVAWGHTVTSLRQVMIKGLVAILQTNSYWLNMHQLEMQLCKNNGIESRVFQVTFFRE